MLRDEMARVYRELRHIRSADEVDEGLAWTVDFLAREFSAMHGEEEPSDVERESALIYRIVSDADARSEKAAGLRALRERFLEHADYFEKQIELDRGIRMLGEIMRSGADVISSGSQ
ncbi:hypothetical protein [Thermophilibacter provencensis]|uniref:Uncharacterized protein n=1 Tax=Thermophilibacter provencensis TaxID=1852386 RepID=A0A921GDT6_9ACTN|nr:hypothetical protein [Thermophilibacter provencensis]HJF44405.1 hypothetical protein [Thermophilibacter provencensis]